LIISGFTGGKQQHGAPQRGDNEIVTQLRIMNQQMDQMANEFGNRLERKHVNYHGKVQIRHEGIEFNITGAVRQVNTNMNEFVAYNTNMSDVDFEKLSVGHGERFGK